ncbi:MAG: LAGLIDADG family homing endonuclease [Candidatus Thermoplasmatota archaeon]
MEEYSRETLAQKWDEFFADFGYSPRIKEVADAYPEARSLYVQFEEIDRFDADLAAYLFHRPQTMLAAGERQIAQLLPPGAEGAEISLRIKGLPSDWRVEIRDIRSKHQGRFIGVRGLVKRVTEVRPRIVEAVFECMRCGHQTRVRQEETLLREPLECPKGELDDNGVAGCGRAAASTSFKVVYEKSTFIDSQKVDLQELPEELKGGAQPQSLTVYGDDDLTGQVFPGDRVTLSGILRSKLRDIGRQRTTLFDIFMELNSIEKEEIEYREVEIAPEDEEQIRALAHDPHLFAKLIRSVSPTIYGLDVEKEALALQLFGGVPKEMPDSTRIRGDIHLLLVGDPGTAKSQLLRYISEMSPRGIYASGKASTGAGLTATAIKDEFGEGRWTLEAGALVLADRGIAAIDELDKMNDQDRSAMHEAMEQQSYHPDTEIMFSNGEKVTIGGFVDEILRAHRHRIIHGKDCEIIPLAGVKDCRILTTDFQDIYPLSIDRVSRHKAPSKFVKITYGNGRSITITPEHPVYILVNDEIREVRADEVSRGMLAPAPIQYPLERNEAVLSVVDIDQRCKEIAFPEAIDGKLARLLGYIVSEGHAYHSPKNRTAEVMIANTSEGLILDACRTVEGLFGFKPCVERRSANGRRTKDMLTLRCISRSLYDFFKTNFPEVIEKSAQKRAPKMIFHASEEIRIQFLLGAFRGDGFHDSERFGYVTNSLGLAKDYVDLLLSIGMSSYIRRSYTYFSHREGCFKSAYKVVLTSSDSQRKFYELIGKDDHRAEEIQRLVKRSFNRRNDHDRVPSDIARMIKNLLRDYRLDDGYLCRSVNSGGTLHRAIAINYIEKVEAHILSLRDPCKIADPREIRKRYSLSLSEVASQINLSPSMVTYIERNRGTKNYAILLSTVRNMARSKVKRSSAALDKLRRLIASAFRFVEVKEVELVQNEGVEWVYDVTVEPTHTFISEGLVLHNTISVAKAGITATLQARCALLGAANPKFGRFEIQQPIVDQINLPVTLLSRFDLIFPIQDAPEPHRDAMVASHILRAHQVGEVRRQKKEGILPPESYDDSVEAEMQPEIDTLLMRKYVSMARKVVPVLSTEAMEELKEYYLRVRQGGGGTMDERRRAVSITARQLEAYIRLSEASARARLSNVVTIDDAQRAIRIFGEYMKRVMGLGTDQYDIDIVATGIPSSQRDEIITIMDIIRDLERVSEEKMAAVDDIIANASKKRISEERVKQIIERLKNANEIYSRKLGYYSTVYTV